MSVTAERVRELLIYYPGSGDFVWRCPRGRGIAAGDQAGSLAARGYLTISIYNKTYLAHRLAWLWMTGAWPSELIDHVNRIKHDNSWQNLRAATARQNQLNRKLHVNNKSGVRGVYLIPSSGKWCVRAMCMNIGHFATFEEAVTARKSAEHRLFGEFAPRD